MENIPDILLVHKPGGMTSFDVIRALRAKIGIRKLGHAGTLDPLAEGLLIIGVGEGTKKLADYIKLDKTYVATILLGLRTATGDIDGNVIERQAVPQALSEDDVRRSLATLVGDIDLPVPAYSAIKQGGVPLYKKARRGETFDAPVRTMRIDRVGFLAFRHERDIAYVEAVLDVGSGTYVRSIAEELGRRLGVPATLSRLVRTRIGGFRLESSYKLEDFDAQ